MKKTKAFEMLNNCSNAVYLPDCFYYNVKATALISGHEIVETLFLHGDPYIRENDVKYCVRTPFFFSDGRWISYINLTDDILYRVLFL